MATAALKGGHSVFVKVVFLFVCLFWVVFPI